MISYGTTEALAHPQPSERPSSCILLIKHAPGVSWASLSLTCSFAHATEKTLNGVVLLSAPRMAMQVLTGDPSAAVRDPASQALACFRLGSALLISPAVLGHAPPAVVSGCLSGQRALCRFLSTSTALYLKASERPFWTNSLKI